MMKAIPYGNTDFPYIIRNNYYYVDKTRFIEGIEQMPNYLFLIRPRRFGKSLTLAMLETYYDIRYATAFDELFGDLYIGKHPTKLHNQFLIMRFNFSEVSSKIEETESSFRTYCCNRMKNFVDIYIDLLGEKLREEIKFVTMPGEMLSLISSYANMKGGLRIYLMIDEYDNFTNTILSTYGTDEYRKA
ncbi:MAG: AAA family ATPase, partial [Tannerellaceae bacterium]